MTEQPTSGGSRGGGQRFGEMEVWALEACGAAYNLRELLTIKSDDISGREDALRALFDGRRLPNPGVPESYKVMARELQSLCISIEAYKQQPNRARALEVDLLREEELVKDALNDSLTVVDTDGNELTIE